MALIAAHLNVGVILLDVKHHVYFQKGFKAARDRLIASLLDNIIYVSLFLPDNKISQTRAGHGQILLESCFWTILKCLNQVKTDSTAQVTRKNEAPHRLSFDLDTTKQKIPKITTPRAAKAYSHHSHIEKTKQKQKRHN